MKKLFLILCLLFSTLSYGAVYQTVQNGSWTNANTWMNGIEPPNTNSDTVYINNNIDIPTGHEVIYGYIIVNDTLTASNNLVVSTNAKFLIYGYIYSSNHIWNFGRIILDYGNICWKKVAPPGFYHGNPIEGWGYICGQGFGPLGITLTSFDCQLIDDKIEIDWVTENEENNDYFTIERSFDLINWEGILNVKGSLYSQGVLTYKVFIEPVYGISYYRLKQTDTNGSFETFDNFIRDIVYKKNCLYPNPFHDYIKTGDSIKELLVIDIFYNEIEVNYSDDLILTDNLKNGLYYIFFNGQHYKMIKE